MEEIITIERYQSRLEPSTVVVEKEGESFNFWIYSHLKKDNEVLSYDRIKSEDLVTRLLAWYKEQENRNIPITKALEYITSQDDTITKALNPAKVKSK